MNCVGKFCFILIGSFLFSNFSNASPISSDVSERIVQLAKQMKESKLVISKEDQLSATRNLAQTLYAELFTFKMIQAEKRSYAHLFLHLAQTGVPEALASQAELPPLNRTEGPKLKALIRLVMRQFPVPKTLHHLRATVKNQMEMDRAASSAPVPVKVEPPLNLNPQISVAQLVTEILLEPRFEGWDVRGLQSGIVPRTKGGSGNALLNKLGLHSELAQIKLYRVNDSPMVITPQTQSFFEGLEREILEKSDGSLSGYKFVLFPNSIIRTEYFTDEAVKAPIPVYLITETSRVLQGLKDREKAVHSLYERRERALELLERNPEQARRKLAEIAREGLPIAAAEAAVLYKKRILGVRDGDLAQTFEEQAEREGITDAPDLDPYVRGRQTPIPPEVLQIVADQDAQFDEEERELEDL